MEQGVAGAVLRRLRDRGPQTKGGLAEAFGLPRTTMSGIVRSLAAEGLVEDGPPAPSSGGRRSVSVRIAASRTFVAVSLGESRVRVATLGGHLTISGGVSIERTDRGADPGALAGDVLEALRTLLDERVPDAIAVAAAVPDDALLGEVARGIAADHPEVPVAVVPAVRAMALGERHAGTLRGEPDLVAVRLGGGVTAAVVSAGRLLLGVGGRSGELGHLRVEEFGPLCRCGRAGCLDAYAGVDAIVERATDLARRGRSEHLAEVLARAGAIGLADVVGAAQTGDAAVVQLARDAGQRIGDVVAGVVALTHPRGVVLGGPVAALGGYLLADTRSAIYRTAPAGATEHLEIAVSELGERAVLIGTGAAAVEAWIDPDARESDSGATFDGFGRNDDEASRKFQMDPD